jgi:non-heme chloroperoxidase
MAHVEIEGTAQVHSMELPTGVRLEYSEQGDPDGVPLLLLHGATDSRRSWDTVLPRLPHSIRAIALSQRGHGDSDRPAGYGIEELAADAAAAIDALELGPAVVAGHSMGAWVAQRLAIEHPERVLGLLLVAPLGTARENAEFAALCAEMSAVEGPVDPGLVREFQLGTTERPLPSGLLDLFVAESLKLPAEVWRALFAAMLEIDLSDGLASLEAPAHVIWGDRDALATRAEQDWLVETIPDARLTVYQGTGHAVHWEEPERFAADLAAFAAAQASRGATVAP